MVGHMVDALPRGTLSVKGRSNLPCDLYVDQAKRLDGLPQVYAANRARTKRRAGFIRRGPLGPATTC
jgi:hypothetical protein